MKVPEKCPLSSSCPVLMGGHRTNRSHSGLVTKELPSRRDMASWEVDGSGIVDRPQMVRVDFQSAQLQSGCDSFSPAVDGGDGGNFLQVSAVEVCERKQADNSARESVVLKVHCRHQHQAGLRWLGKPCQEKQLRWGDRRETIKGQARRALGHI